MRVRVPRLMMFMAAAGLAVSCGKSSTGPSGSSNPGLTATVDGAAFTGSSPTATPTAGTPGSVVITAAQASGSTMTTLTLSLGFLSGPGTYPIGVNQATTPGGTLNVAISGGGASSTYATPLTGAAGTVTITTLTSTSIIGTFQATAAPVTPTTGAGKNVTNGSFNLTMSGFTPSPSTNAGSTMTATLGTAPFTAATVTGTGSGGVFSIVGTSATASGPNTSITMTTTQAVTAGSTVPFQAIGIVGPSVSILVVSGGSTFGGGTAGDSGSVTISSIADGFVKGTFAGTVVGPTGTLTISNGAFNAKIQ